MTLPIKSQKRKLHNNILCPYLSSQMCWALYVLSSQSEFSEEEVTEAETIKNDYISCFNILKSKIDNL